MANSDRSEGSRAMARARVKGRVDIEKKTRPHKLAWAGTDCLLIVMLL